jgi:cytochrome oxidase Cu insertion factor (SCO1/SenC/PrrC family)
VPSGIRLFDNGSYAVDHSAAILAFNSRGELRAIFSPPHTVAALAADYRLLAKDRG